MKRVKPAPRRDRHTSAPVLPTESLLECSPRVQGVNKLEPKTERQRDMIATIGANQLTFVDGPAGTGKTYVAAAMAALALKNKEVKQVIITRPNVEAGSPMGFLPGDKDEKFDPYFLPVKQVFERILGAATVEMYIKNGKIATHPLAFMRGHTFEDAFVLADEMQNSTPKEMELFLTRTGEYSRVVVDGDPYQKDTPGNVRCGLSDAIGRLGHVRSVGFVTFTIDDIVRSGLVREVILAYRNKPRISNDNDTDERRAPAFLGIGTS